jgi:predicted AAA+ superfamily ATPase
MIKIVRNFSTLIDNCLKGLESLDPGSNLIQVVLGPRQVGKTTALQQIASTWPGPVVFASADT